MMTELNEIIDKLESGAVVLTANKRLSRYLEVEYESRQLSAGQTSWLRPLLYPFDSWCHQQYEWLPESLPVISRSQGNLVWERIIEDSIRQSEHELLQIVSTAQVSWKAEQLLLRYRTSFNKSEATEDQSMFLQWQSAWRQQLDKLGMVDAASLPLLLASSITAFRDKLPAEIIFIGFDDIDPAIRHLQCQFEAVGCKVVNSQPHYYADNQIERIRCSDRTDEIRHCAVRINELVRENPEFRIGVVATNLKRDREEIEKIFRAELDPHSFMLGKDDTSPFNMSEAPALAEEPVVYAALKLLRIGNMVEIDALGSLLRSPFLVQSETATFERATCDRELRRLRRSQFRVSSLDTLLEKFKCDRGFVHLIRSFAKLAQISKARLPGEWAEHFTQVLDQAGWPGEGTLSSREYQAVDRFRRLLVELSSLDQVASPLKRQDVVNRLCRMAADVEFQPEGAASGINVVGLLEASGMQFDFLWVLGLHAGALPAKPHPNPFIPVALQHRLQMPHADASRELDYAGNVVARLFSSAPVVIASWPQTEEGMRVMMSHFLNTLPEIEKTPLESSDPSRLIHRSDLPLENLHDSDAPPVVSRKTISGGTSIIKDQALCPFRAFAHHRLRAEALEEPDIGIDAMTRGSLVHKVLELFWKEVRTQQKLLKMEPDQLEQKVRESVVAAVDKSRWNLPEGQRQIETDRLVRLSLKWLKVEKQRSGFEVIEWEQEHTEKIGRLQIRAIIDRIDQLENGQLAIIDYKTGRPEPAQWFDERITEPQMPIYCQQIDPGKIDAVTFAVVRPGQKECKFKGIARDSKEWPGINEKTQQELLSGRAWGTFDQILENWRIALPGLGNDFMNGVATVDPQDRDKACRFCDLMPLCRLHEEETWVAGGNDD